MKAQHFGSLPALYAVTHHTYIPTPDTWKGESSLRGLERYYRSLGWPAFPHFWVGTKSGPGSPLGLWVLQHPRWDGIHVAGWNHRSIGMEYVWNGDEEPFTSQMLRIGAITWQAIQDKIDIPLELTTDSSPGHFFHRDKASKSCPGYRNKKDAIITSYRMETGTEDEMTEEDREIQRYTAMWALEAKLDANIAKHYARGDETDAQILENKRPQDIAYWRERWNVR